MAAFNLNDAVLGGTFDMSGQGSGERGARWSHDGTKLYMASGSPTVVYQYTASAAFDASSLSYSGNSKNLGADRRHPSFNSAGTRMFLFLDGTATVYQWNLSTAWDITSATDSGNTLSVNAQEPNPTGIDVSDDGAYLFVAGAANDTLVRYTMSTPGDLSTATFTDNMTLSGDTPTVEMLVAASGGLYFAYGQGAQDHTWMRKINAAFDLSSGTAASGSTDRDLSSLVGGTYRLVDINPTGTRLYVIRNSTLYELIMASDGGWQSAGRRLWDPRWG